MKTAYLIIAHKNIKQLEFLINAVANSDSLVFVHCDSNWNCDYSKLKKENVMFLENRIHGVLFDWSLVQIELNLLEYSSRFAKENNIHIGYYCLLSGQDFPIINPLEIQNDLKHLYPKPIIDCTPRSNTNWLSKRAEHIKFFAINEPKIAAIADKYPKVVRRIIKLPIYTMDKAASLITNCQKVLDKNKISLFGGSQWWVLPDSIVEEIMKNYLNNTRLFRCCRYIYGPDETFFQTMIMNGDFSDTVDLNPPEMVLQNNKTFSFFRKPGKPVTGHPYAFTDSDFEMLKQLYDKKYYFVRKIDFAIDENIATRIMNDLW